ncbi:hypothetical protein B0H19DRAFT_1065221 [Mycena capillaripes]|nr:hypothetical protein B0H19DRAFT_1065221 [Mycena capillaripes]
MPTKPSDAEIRLNDITTCLTITAQTLGIVATSLKTPFLEAISNTTQSLLKKIQLMETTYQLLEVILIVHINSDTGGELPPSILNHIGKITQTLHKIHTFIEGQQSGNKVKKFFRQSEMSTLLKDCKAGLQQGFEYFQIGTTDLMRAIREMQEDAHKRQQEVLNMIEALSKASKSDRASLVKRFYGFQQTSANL